MLDEAPPFVHERDYLRVIVPPVDKVRLVEAVVYGKILLAQKRNHLVGVLARLLMDNVHAELNVLEDAVALIVYRDEDFVPLALLRNEGENPAAFYGDVRVNPNALLAVGKEDVRMRLVPPGVFRVVKLIEGERLNPPRSIPPPHIQGVRLSP